MTVSLFARFTSSSVDPAHKFWQVMSNGSVDRLRSCPCIVLKVPVFFSLTLPPEGWKVLAQESGLGA